MKKRIIAVIMAVLMVCTLLPVSALAAGTSSGKCGENLTWTLDSAGTLTISGTGSMDDFYIENGDPTSPWYGQRERIKKVVVNNGVTSVGLLAFYNCMNITSVSLPDSVKSIGTSAFSNCSKLTGICIPDGVTGISDRAFAACDALKSVSIPNSVTSIGQCAFNCCYALEDIKLPSGLTYIGPNAFTNCISLSSISIPGSVKTIDYGAFAWCTGLKSVSISDGVESIGSQAFFHCEMLSYVKLSDSVTNLGSAAFMGCANLSSISLPKGLKSISNNTFADCSSLTCIGIPESVESIGIAICYESEMMTDIYFAGSEEQWSKISIGEYNDNLMKAKIHYNSKLVVNPFTDVSDKAYYYEPVMWAVENDITKGTSETTFSPAATCTRGQVVTFLWRAMGCPEVEGVDNPFADVKPGDYFYKAVMWAVKEGVTQGIDPTHFGPGKTVTRGQTVTFLWRAAGQDAVVSENVFSDVAPGDYFYNAVMWAVENEVTKGTSNTTFSPAAGCTRGQIVTFLYRAAA